MDRRSDSRRQPPASEILDQVPPHDLAAERALLGSVVLRADVLDDLAGLEEHHFHAHGNAVMYRHLKALHDRGRPIDPTILTERLRRAKDLEAVGGVAYLAEVMQSVPHAGNARHYAEIVIRLAGFRQLCRAATAMLQRGYGADGELALALEEADAALQAIGSGPSTKQAATATEVLAEAMAHLDAIASGTCQPALHTGLVQFDAEVGGLAPGELVILAARPGVGKTALACQIAEYTASKGRATYYATLEMSRMVLAERIVCGLAGINSLRIRTGAMNGEERAGFCETASTLAQAPLYFDDRNELAISDVRRSVLRLRKKAMLQLAVVDYLQLMRAPDQRIKRYEQIGQITKGLKQLARDANIPIVCLCQVNRQGVDEPDMQHLRESGNIEADADIVLIIHRRVGEEGGDRTWLLVRKNRNAPPGRFKLLWLGSRTRFAESDWAEDQEPSQRGRRKPWRKRQDAEHYTPRDGKPAGYRDEFSEYAT